MDNKSKMLFEEAKKYIPGGVNSPVRAFKSVGISPLFIKKANGSKIYDVDDNEYIDFIGSWGPMILGHNNSEVFEKIVDALKYGTSFGAPTEAEIELAKLICSVYKGCEMVRMVNSGTEATMSAIRLARGYTNKNKIVKFEGCYHGHSDGLLIKAGSGATTLGVPDSPGVPDGYAKNTILAKYNDIENVKEIFKLYGDDIACVIIEPVAGNMGVVSPKENFLKSLKEIAKEYGSLVIFDEVMTGFRLSLGGAAELYNITPDLVTFGKIIGGGLPVGAYGGKKEIMENVAPSGKVYQAGTLSGNPIAMASGIATLKILKENPNIYTNLEEKSNALENGILEILKRLDLNYKVNRVGSMLCLFFTQNDVIDFETALNSDTTKFSKYFIKMLEMGIYLPPSQFEAIFISNSHTKSDIEKTLEGINIALSN